MADGVRGDDAVRVAVAGTFGPVHDGHRALLEEALRYGSGGVLVAVSSDEFANEPRDRPVPPFGDRVRGVIREVGRLDEWGREVTMRKLDTELEYASTDPTLDALVVSPETVAELDDVNDRRREAGLEPLVGLVVPYVLSEDGARISSTRIVRGEIDEHGAVLDG